MFTRVVYLLFQLMDRGEEIWQSSLLQLRGGERAGINRLKNYLIYVRSRLRPWASAGLTSESEAQKKLWPNKRLNQHERGRRLLHRLSTIRASMMLFIAIVLGQVLPAVLLANADLSVPKFIRPLYLQLSGSSLLTTAEILAAVVGIVIAITVFGIQFHGEKEGDLAFLLPLFGKRMGILPISAFFLAVRDSWPRPFTKHTQL